MDDALHAAAQIAGASESHEQFLLACRTVRTLLLHATDPARRTIRRANARISGEVLSVAGMEEALAALGFVDSDGGTTLTLQLEDGVQTIGDAIAALDKVAGELRRRDDRLVARTSDPMGWSAELHEPTLLLANPKFKGAVFDQRPLPGAPSGVIVFHNSPFSNFWRCGVTRE